MVLFVLFTVLFWSCTHKFLLFCICFHRQSVQT